MIPYSVKVKVCLGIHAPPLRVELVKYKIKFLNKVVLYPLASFPGLPTVQFLITYIIVGRPGNKASITLQTVNVAHTPEATMHN